MKKTIVFVAVGAVLALGAILFLSNQPKSPTNNTPPAPSPTTNPVQSVSPEPSVTGTTSPVQTFRIEGVPYSFSLKEIRVKMGDRVRVEFTSKQGMHDWVLDEFNVKTKQLTAGQSDTVEFTADKKGTFEYYCSVNNHRAMGMVGNLIVE